MSLLMEHFYHGRKQEVSQKKNRGGEKSTNKLELHKIQFHSGEIEIHREIQQCDGTRRIQVVIKHLSTNDK